ncbi:hypothetical protein POM88_004956 [Heracleum sosnowskyi]|uniref:Pentatricopeptide repeat-containing protein n=1 Tax=Heracleum sosnowskyi TaxID=360622 RepID=A0AAD8JKM0_9APIA|nr:hypothetical protein POM88_004956 [Heracleum sosnowskyi]
MDWSAYVLAGDMGKAVASLKTSEQIIPVATRKSAFHFLMTMYANMGKKDEVYRIWNLYKKRYRICNTGYLCMMSSLVKLDYLDGVRKVYDEWEAKNVSIDFRLPNFLISAYCRKGLLAKAESILQRLLEDGKEPNASTWARMAFGYRSEKQMEKAVEALEKSLLASGPGSEDSELKLSVFYSCLKYLNKKGDLDRIEHIKRLLQKQGNRSAYAIQRLVNLSKEEITQTSGQLIPLRLMNLLWRKRCLKHQGQKISQWMSGKSFLDLSSADVVVQLDLTSKVHGVEQAEDFFNKIPDSSKNFQIYGILLNCYADAKLLEKAEAVMDTMRNLHYADTNIMLKLYYHLRMHDKLVYLVQEMDNNGIELDVFTYNVLLDAYVGALDIDRMEKLLMKMESDFLVTMDWNTYVLAAKAYLVASNIAKAYNNSLEELDDIDNVQKVYDEWKAKTSEFNPHLPDFLISAYCKKGLVGKAETILQKFLQHDAVPSARTWTAMAYGYLKEK